MGNNPVNGTHPPNRNGNTLCWSDLSGTVLKGQTTVRCFNPWGLMGRFVSIQYIGSTDQLTLCEVKVFGPAPGTVPPAPPPKSNAPPGMIEVARGQPAYQQSSLNPSTGAVRAVDGLQMASGASPTTTAPYCAVTAEGMEPWW